MNECSLPHRLTVTTCSIDGQSRDGLVGVVLERHDGSPAPCAVGGDQHLRLGVVDAFAQRLGAESAEHDRVRGADASAGEHRDGQLGHHAQVDVDPIAFVDPERPQPVREPADVIEQLGVGDRAGVARLAFPMEGDLVAAAGFHVTVEAVVRGVQLPSFEPPHPRRRPVHDRVPTLEPRQPVGLLGPERLRGRRSRAHTPTGRTRSRVRRSQAVARRRATPTGAPRCSAGCHSSVLQCGVVAAGEPASYARRHGCASRQGACVGCACTEGFSGPPSGARLPRATSRKGGRRWPTKAIA